MRPEAVLLLCQVSELEHPMDEGDGVALMDPDFPEDALPEKTANVAQVVAQKHSDFSDRQILRLLLKLCRKSQLFDILCARTVMQLANFVHEPNHFVSVMNNSDSVSSLCLTWQSTTSSS